jgi:hypothetical protein
MQAGAGDEQPDRERGAPERVRYLMPDCWQRQMQDVDGKPDRAGPDQGLRTTVMAIARTDCFSGDA